jgi:hypothetical protein
MRVHAAVRAMPAVVLLVAGCSGGGKGAAPAAATPTASPCPPAAGPSPSWPLAVPPDLPRPPGAVLESSTVSNHTTIVRFSTGQRLREAIVWTVKEVRAAGYRLGRGDAEATEADAPFSGPTVVGTFRMVQASECVTIWLLAVAKRVEGINDNPDTKPLLPYTPKGSPSPLPFG